VSPVFRHGGLRLYLLKLLDESPRHGYDVIRLLQDRFLGVYSPSPGTIYPRLARLEEEGLVTHDLVDGKKVYKITDAGRDELNRRLDDLADLEDELSDSVRDIAREISRDVRETVRSLRDEFTWAVREAGKTGSDAGRRERPTGGQAAAEAAAAESDAAGAAPADAADAAAAEAGADTVWSEAAGEPAAGAEQAEGSARGAEQADGSAPGPEQAGGSAPGPEQAGESAAGAEQTGESGRSRDSSGGSDRSAGRESRSGRWPSGGWREWADWAERRDWREWADWAEQRNWGEWASKQEWKDCAKASHKEWKEWAKAGKQERAASGARRREADRDLVVDLERLAAAFAREIRGVAWQTEALSEDAVGNLGRILTDALNRVRNEVFRPPGPGKEDS